MKKVYLYDEYGVFTSAYDAQESPLEPGVFIIPNLSTDSVPILAPKSWPVLINGKWESVPDYRGVAFDTATGAEIEHKELGNLPDNLTLIAKPSGDYLWSNGEWVATSNTPLPVPIITVTPWQIRKALNQLGLRAAVESAITTSTDQTLKDGWEFSNEITRNSPLVISMATALNKTIAEIDGLFALAVTL
jgi:hypothetical protein